MQVRDKSKDKKAVINNLYEDMRSVNSNFRKNSKEFQNPYMIDFVCRIKLFRIAFGYSQEELTFLLGYQSKRITAIELFTSGPGYLIRDLAYLSHVFGCSHHQFFPDGLVTNQEIAIRTVQYRQSGKLIHEIWENKKDGSEELLWKVPEQDPKIFHFPEDIPDVIKETTEMIAKLISERYFDDPKETAEVFKICREAIGYELKPRYLEKALELFTAGREGLYLKKVKEGHRHAYAKAEG